MASERDEMALPLLPGHNEAVMKARDDFWREAKMRRQKQKQAGKIAPAQQYVRRELDIAFSRSENGDERSQILLLKKVFEREGLPGIVKRELNQIKKSGFIGAVLVGELVRVYGDYNLSQTAATKSDDDDHLFPQIVCSLSLS